MQVSRPGRSACHGWRRASRCVGMCVAAVMLNACGDIPIRESPLETNLPETMGSIVVGETTGSGVEDWAAWALGVAGEMDPLGRRVDARGSGAGG